MGYVPCGRVFSECLQILCVDHPQRKALNVFIWLIEPSSNLVIEAFGCDFMVF